jgi:hypothetical protein
MLKELRSYDCSTIRQDTPDGTMFVTIIEDEKAKPIEVLVSIGKTGTSIRAWTEAVQGLCNMVLSKGGGLTDIVNSIDSITTDKAYRNIRSGPEGLVRCISVYLRSRADLIKDEKPSLDMPWI